MTRAVDSFELHFDWMNRLRDVAICLPGAVFGWIAVLTWLCLLEVVVGWPPRTRTRIPTARGLPATMHPQDGCGRNSKNA